VAELVFVASTQRPAIVLVRCGDNPTGKELHIDPGDGQSIHLELHRQWPWRQKLRHRLHFLLKTNEKNQKTRISILPLRKGQTTSASAAKFL
jgi:hypothetical protein